MSGWKAVTAVHGNACYGMQQGCILNNGGWSLCLAEKNMFTALCNQCRNNNCANNHPGSIPAVYKSQYNYRHPHNTITQVGGIAEKKIGSFTEIVVQQQESVHPPHAPAQYQQYYSGNGSYYHTCFPLLLCCGTKVHEAKIADGGWKLQIGSWMLGPDIRNPIKEPTPTPTKNHKPKTINQKETTQAQAVSLTRTQLKNHQAMPASSRLFFFSLMISRLSMMGSVVRIREVLFSFHQF